RASKIGRDDGLFHEKSLGDHKSERFGHPMRLRDDVDLVEQGGHIVAKSGKRDMAGQIECSDQIVQMLLERRLQSEQRVADEHEARVGTLRDNASRRAEKQV